MLRKIVPYRAVWGALFAFFVLFAGVAIAQEGSLIVQWDPNTESDLAGYRVYYGEASGAYSHQIDVGNVTSCQIHQLTVGKIYFVAVTAYDYWNNESRFSKEVSGKAAVHLKSSVSPDVFVLFQNYPNPFNPTTVICYSVPFVASVRLSILDDRGRLVKELHHGQDQPGLHSFLWDGRNSYGHAVASGTYFARLKSGAFVLSQKILLLR